jgi:ubiquinone biosynthesis protein
MFNASSIEALLRQSSPEQLRSLLSMFLAQSATGAERTRTLESVLQSPTGERLRAEMGRWIVEQIVPVEALVPEEYAKWRPPVRDAMTFVVSRLSAPRLAPKILELIELPPETPAEERLLRLIAKVPGLQKLGQVLARNRHLRPSFRNALARLENGIRDVKAEDICTFIRQQLGARMKIFGVVLEPAIMSEASVSAVVRFTWQDPVSGQRERGVFKVLKPHIPACFAEDMDFLQGLAEFFASRHREYGFAKHVLTDTFTKVRRLLQHEVDFLGEQKTLVEAATLYDSISGVRVPRVIQPLCTPSITALTEEPGVKITDAVRHLPAWRRGLVAEQMIQALIAVPLFAPAGSSLFHADPHAGNLLYNAASGELVILDWALTERLSREQRRHLALLVFMVSLRDPVGACLAIQSLSEYKVRRHSREAKLIRKCVAEFFEEIPLRQLPGAVDAMRLLQRVAVKGIRFPAPLIMLSKVLFTLDGIVEDIGGSAASMVLTMVLHALQRYLRGGATSRLPLTIKDWMMVECSAMLFSGRLSIKLEETMLDRLLPGNHAHAANRKKLKRQSPRQRPAPQTAPA